MRVKDIILFMLIFALGCVSVSLIYEVGAVLTESPVQVIKNPIESIGQTISAAANGKAVEKISPGDHISENQIKVYNDKVELDIQNAVWSKFSDTNSMDPFFDQGANGIEVIPKTENDIQIGDVISYQSTDGDIVIHRVTKIDKDENGTFYTVKGDNNPVQDPQKVRFSEIKGILVGVIY